MIFNLSSGDRRSDNGDPAGAADLAHCQHDLVRAAHSALVLRRNGHLEEAAAEEHKAATVQALLNRLRDAAPTGPTEPELQRRPTSLHHTWDRTLR